MASIANLKQRTDIKELAITKPRMGAPALLRRTVHAVALPFIEKIDIALGNAGSDRRPKVVTPSEYARCVNAANLCQLLADSPHLDTKNTLDLVESYVSSSVTPFRGYVLDEDLTAFIETATALRQRLVSLIGNIQWKNAPRADEGTVDEFLHSGSTGITCLNQKLRGAYMEAVAEAGQETGVSFMESKES